MTVSVKLAGPCAKLSLNDSAGTDTGTEGGGELPGTVVSKRQQAKKQDFQRGGLGMTADAQVAASQR